MLMKITAGCNENYIIPPMTITARDLGWYYDRVKLIG
tara:strand:+ start:1710 stop:1820 length:111 start_codon:yes stop_codon:yes gene_type:complete